MTARDLGPSPAQIDRMRRKVGDGIATVARRRAHLRRAASGIGAIAIAAAVTAGTLNAGFKNDPTDGLYLCHLVDARDTVITGIGYPIDLVPPPAGSEEAVATAIEMCEASYERLGVDAPDPAVCNLFDNRLAVFPNSKGLENDAFCDWIGLPGPLSTAG